MSDFKPSMEFISRTKDMIDRLFGQFLTFGNRGKDSVAEYLQTALATARAQGHGRKVCT